MSEPVITVSNKALMVRNLTGRPLWKVSIAEHSKSAGGRAKYPCPTRLLTNPRKNPIKAPSVLKYPINENRARMKQTAAIIPRRRGVFASGFFCLAGAFTLFPAREGGFPRFVFGMSSSPYNLGNRPMVISPKGSAQARRRPSNNMRTYQSLPLKPIA